jgi:hypothetical protein
MLQFSCLSISARLASSQPAAPTIRVIEIIDDDDELLEDLAIATARANNWRPPPGTTATRTSSRGACGRSDATASGRRAAGQQLMDDYHTTQFEGRVIVVADRLATRRATE